MTDMNTPFQQKKIDLLSLWPIDTIWSKRKTASRGLFGSVAEFHLKVIRWVTGKDTDKIFVKHEPVHMNRGWTIVIWSASTWGLSLKDQLCRAVLACL